MLELIPPLEPAVDTRPAVLAEGQWSSRGPQSGTVLALGKTDQACESVVRARDGLGHRFTLVSGGRYLIRAMSSGAGISLRDRATGHEFAAGSIDLDAEFPAGQTLALYSLTDDVIGSVSLSIRKLEG